MSHRTLQQIIDELDTLLPDRLAMWQSPTPPDDPMKELAMGRHLEHLNKELSEAAARADISELRQLSRIQLDRVTTSIELMTKSPAAWLTSELEARAEQQAERLGKLLGEVLPEMTYSWKKEEQP